MMTMTRRVGFSAAHADWLPRQSREENLAQFGSKASPEPYGHNYLLDVSVNGIVAPETGIIVNIKAIDKIVKERIVQQFDRKFINRQVAAFGDQPVTVETLLTYFAAQLEGNLPPEVRLSGLRLEPAPQRYGEWRPENSDRAENEDNKNNSMQITHRYEFSASHRLDSPHLSEAENQELFGKCNYIYGHGHNYELEVTVAGPVQSGRVVDGDALDAVVSKEVVERYDHRHLNHDIPEFEGRIPSAEIITLVIWERLRDHIPAPARLTRVLLKETGRNFFEYRGEEDKV